MLEEAKEEIQLQVLNKKFSFAEVTRIALNKSMNPKINLLKLKNMTTQDLVNYRKKLSDTQKLNLYRKIKEEQLKTELINTSHDSEALSALIEKYITDPKLLPYILLSEFK